MQVPRIGAGFSAGWRGVAIAAAVMALAATPAPGGVLTGIDAYRKGDFKTALKAFKNDAKAGDKRAQYNLGVMLLKGTGVQKDAEAALKWHRRAADQGYPAAQHGLGVMYYRGDGVDKDHGEAIKWFRKAAEQGFAQAQLNLGVMYFTGHGLPKDGAEVVKWIALAAAKGLAEAQFRLGTMYDKGMIFRTDRVEAARWYAKASKQGHDKSVSALAAARLAAASPAAGTDTRAPKPAAADTSPGPELEAVTTNPVWRVQLASFRSAAEADVAWRPLRNSHPELFDGLTAATVEANLGPERGIYHRLTAGPFDSGTAARALCRDIKQRAPRQGCLPLSR